MIRMTPAGIGDRIVLVDHKHLGKNLYGLSILAETRINAADIAIGIQR